MKTILTLVAILSSAVVFSQPYTRSDLKEYNEEKEKILNLVLNTVQFDSIYSFEKVYFLENELLSVKTPLILKKHNEPIEVLSNAAQKERKIDYVNIGDFTLSKSGHCSLQLYSSSTGFLLNVSLEKSLESDWKIVNHIIMEQ